MFTRTHQSAVLKNEGHDVPYTGVPELKRPVGVVQGALDKPHEMALSYKFVDPENYGKKKPVVDVSAPFNPLDETHQTRKFGVQKLGYNFLSMNAFTQVIEEVPYTDTHHTSECVKWWWLGANVWYFNLFIARAQNSSNVTGMARTSFAWGVALMAGFVRINIATLIGAGGYFYTYEYLYTHGVPFSATLKKLYRDNFGGNKKYEDDPPKPWMQINDPSPNGWKRAWDDGQNCFLPRLVASVFPALGYAFFMGRWKKSMFWFLVTASSSMYYEYARIYIFSGNRLFYSYQANKELERQAAWGSLMPKLIHEVDPDTNRNESVAQFRYFRITSGTLQDTVWENATHENLPFFRTGMKLPNPYFNWQKAPQTYNAKAYEVKNDLWTMPEVLNAQMRTGTMDM